jgi:hypothetical protein
MMCVRVGERLLQPLGGEEGWPSLGMGGKLAGGHGQSGCIVAGGGVALFCLLRRMQREAMAVGCGVVVLWWSPRDD